MEFVYYLVKNQEIVKITPENNKDIVAKLFKNLCIDSDEMDDINVFIAPFDVPICEYNQLLRYGTNVTRDYIDDDDIIIL